MIICHYAGYTLIVPNVSEKGMKASVYLDNDGYMRWFNHAKQIVKSEKLTKPRNECTISECIDLWDSVWTHRQYSDNVYIQKR